MIPPQTFHCPHCGAPGQVNSGEAEYSCTCRFSAALAAGASSIPTPAQEADMTTVDSTSDQRTVNNVMRHQYRVLTDTEKAQMQAIKDKGLELHDLIEGIGASRELSLAKTKTEEAVMWAVKHLTR